MGLLYAMWPTEKIWTMWDGEKPNHVVIWFYFFIPTQLQREAKYTIRGVHSSVQSTLKTYLIAENGATQPSTDRTYKITFPSQVCSSNQRYLYMFANCAQYSYILQEGSCTSSIPVYILSTENIYTNNQNGMANSKFATRFLHYCTQLSVLGSIIHGRP